MHGFATTQLSDITTSMHSWSFSYPGVFTVKWNKAQALVLNLQFTHSFIFQGLSLTVGCTSAMQFTTKTTKCVAALINPHGNLQKWYSTEEDDQKRWNCSKAKQTDNSGSKMTASIQIAGWRECQCLGCSNVLQERHGTGGFIEAVVKRLCEGH